MFGKEVETTMGAQPNAINARLYASGDGPVLNLVDFPGAGQLRESLLRAAAAAGALAVVIDATGDSAHLSGAASLLYDLMTSRGVIHPPSAGNAPPLLLVAHKADSDKARSTEQLRKELEADLERLKVSRASIVTAGGEDDDEDRVLLGVQGKAFTFAQHAPMRVTWARASSKGGKPQLAEVQAFILDNVA
jgi:signal recognition particle receptor subunit beta